MRIEDSRVLSLSAWFSDALLFIHKEGLVMLLSPKKKCSQSVVESPESAQGKNTNGGFRFLGNE